MDYLGADWVIVMLRRNRCHAIIKYLNITYKAHLSKVCLTGFMGPGIRPGCVIRCMGPIPG